MAQRLATVYVKACLELTEAEMNDFIKLVTDHQASLQVKVLENGGQEVVVSDDAGAEIVLAFERESGMYVWRSTGIVCKPALAELMRKAVSRFKGDAIVNRIYTGFTMVYHYDRGVVTKIVEQTKEAHKVVYEYSNTAESLRRIFQSRRVESEIEQLQQQIDALLDLRNDVSEALLHEIIDQRLHWMSHQLFVLEA